MLTSCFAHLSGIGQATESLLHKAGLDSWEKAQNHPAPPIGHLSRQAFRHGLEESRQKLAEGDALWFSERLTPREQWRLFPHFRHLAAYVDIETNGLDRERSSITTIALYDGATLKTYVQGHNLEVFPEDLARYTLLVTWNGRSFDVPFLRRALRIPLRMAHLDLCPVFRSLNLRGGLKKVEKILGLDRAELDGVDGLTAVRLWREYERGRCPSALETLLAYNAEDVFSLESLCLHACAARGVHLPPAAARALNPFRTDTNLLARLVTQRMY